MARRKKVSNDLTVHLILDRSGSMNSIKKEAISAFNNYITNLQKDNPESRFSLTIFDSGSIDTIVDNVPAREATLLNEETYQPRAMTPLYDAIGKVISKLENVSESKKALVILTDGEENFSREFSKDSIKKSLDEKQEKYNWLVIYLGANQDAFAEGAKVGTSRNTTLNFNPQNIGTTMNVAYAATMRYARTGSSSDAAFSTEEREAVSA